MIDNLPKGWRVEKLANIVNRMHQGINTAADKVEFSMDGYPIIQTRNITKGILDFDNIKYINESDWEKYKNKYKPEINQILLTNIGTIGKSVIVKKDEDYLIHWNIFLIEPKNELISSDYLKSFFDKLYENKYYDLFLKGGTVKFISKSFLIDLEIPIPPLQQQEKIVKVLDLSSNLIEKQKELLKNYDLFLKSKFIEMFGDPITNPMGWEVVNFEDIMILQRGYDLPINDRAIDGEIEVYGSNGVLDYHSEAKVRNGGVITGRSGTLGKVHYTLGDYWPLNTTLFSKDLKGNNIIYLAYFLEMFKVERFSQGAGVPTLNRNLVHKEKTYKVSLELQNKFASIVEKIETMKEKENQKLKQLENLHNSLMQKAFKGEIE